MKSKPEHLAYRRRELPPKAQATKKGIVLYCPFCQQPHPLIPGEQTPCGTYIRVMAVQEILPDKFSRKHPEIVCLKCKKSGGDMIHFNAGFVHLKDCDPKTRFLAVPPKFSVPARLIYGLPKKVRNLVEKRTGQVQEAREIDSKGIETGKILGYFFVKSKGLAPNG